MSCIYHQEPHLYTVIHGDCILELHPDARGLFANFNLIFADPPFNLGKEFDVPMTDDEYYAWCKRWIDNCWEALAPQGSFFLMTIQEHVGKMMEYMGRHGHFKNLIVWCNSSMPVKNRFCVGYQPILYYVKDKKNFTFNYGAEKRHSNAAIPWGKENNAHSIKDIWDDIPFVSGGCMASKEAVLQSGSKKKVHSAQMPLKLADRIIKYCSNDGDAVLDPFAGSGTTLVSAVSLKRWVVGIEKNEEYCKLIVDRLSRPRRENEDIKHKKETVDLFDDGGSL